MEQKAASDRLLAALRSEWRVPAALQRLYADTAWLQQLVAEELRPRPGRIRTSVRMAFISAVGAALMAALHINSVLGPDTLWVALYASNSLMTAGAGLVMVMAAAALLIASVPLALLLVQAPWVLLPFFGLATALMAYGLNKRRLVGVWLLIEIGFLDTFYLCVFDPQNFGWSVAYTFSGIALAIAVLVAFDMVLWPDPAERALLRSLTDRSTDASVAALSEAVADLSRQIAQAVIALAPEREDSSDKFGAKLNYVLGQLDLTHSKKLRVLADPAFVNFCI